MTPEEWETCQHPQLMLESLAGRVSERKLRLFVCACWTGAARLASRDRDLILGKVREVERWAEGGEPPADDPPHLWIVAQPEAYETALVTVQHLAQATPAREAVPLGKLCRLLRCLLDNPWRPAVITPAVLAWQSKTAVRVARAIYEDRCWEDMPLLGDALEEAGCNDQTILDHCRSPGPHALGCHVLDTLLGRS